ncbi:hypothetical protein [Paenibacillus donghaensis]|uniref:Uncharacterized protein n=1 Tax=Paenibacillus donghaensis TaxID=414771 RepID=A0A2Z2KF59_9BACL|nr:hypothetical protein [Paenibacillus donghaensis]ASA24754.1 hypothetical protein B9T62_30755 [Paenibacillus donghaensis]
MTLYQQWPDIDSDYGGYRQKTQAISHGAKVTGKKITFPGASQIIEIRFTKDISLFFSSLSQLLFTFTGGLCKEAYSSTHSLPAE